MLKKMGFVSLLLALLVSFGPSLLASPPAPSPGAGSKAADAADPADPGVPATTQLGMIIMVLLVMTASTGAMLSGGILRGGPRERPAAATTAPDASATQESAAQRGQDVLAKKAPKSRPKQAQVQRRGTQAQARKGWDISRRSATRAGSRRRGGPGCRGVR
jgi:hypothetical protein